MRKLWNSIRDFFSDLAWTYGLSDGPSCDAADDWECGPQGAGYLPVEEPAHEPE